MGDVAVTALGGRTPLEAATTPGFDRIASQGRVGRLQTIYRNLPIGSIVANLGLLGYNPHEHYPSGRASFEALGQGIEVGPEDLVFRCNLIAVCDGKIADFTAGSIEDGMARSALGALDFDFGGLEVEMYPGMSYRNLLVVRGAKLSADEIVCYEPHTSIGEPYLPLLPQGKTRRARLLMEPLRKALVESVEQLERANRELGSKADMIWLWSPSSPPTLPSFRDCFGVTGAVVCAMDFLKGIAVAAGLSTSHIPDANAYIDTNYRGKLVRAMEYIEGHDFVLVHVNAPDEEAHKRDVAGKIRAIELLDGEIVSPLLRHLDDRFPDNYRIAVTADHYTLLSDGTHTAHPVPLAWAGTAVEPDSATRFTEAEAGRHDSEQLSRSFEFLPRFLAGSWK